MTETKMILKLPHHLNKLIRAKAQSDRDEGIKTNKEIIIINLLEKHKEELK